MRADHAEALGVLVHELHERLFGSRNPLRQGDRGIVSRLHDHSQDQQFHGHRLAEFNEGS